MFLCGYQMTFDALKEMQFWGEFNNLIIWSDWKDVWEVFVYLK
jgi:hypothetical protein